MKKLEEIETNPNPSWNSSTNGRKILADLGNRTELNYLQCTAFQESYYAQRTFDVCSMSPLQGHIETGGMEGRHNADKINRGRQMGPKFHVPPWQQRILGIHTIHLWRCLPIDALFSEMGTQTVEVVGILNHVTKPVTNQPYWWALVGAHYKQL